MNRFSIWPHQFRQSAQVAEGHTLEMPRPTELGTIGVYVEKIGNFTSGRSPKVIRFVILSNLYH